jgi:hypothetical protein
MCPAGGMTEIHRGMPVHKGAFGTHCHRWDDYNAQRDPGTQGDIWYTLVTLWYHMTDIPVMQNDI